MSGNSDDPGYQNFNVPAPPVVFPASGGLLSAIARFFNNLNQAFTVVVGVDFQDGQFIPPAGPFEVLVANDDEFSAQVAGTYKVSWSLTVEETGAANPAVCESHIFVDGVIQDGTTSQVSLVASASGDMSGSFLFTPAAVPANSLRLRVLRVSGTGTPQVVDDMAEITFERIT